MLPYVLIFGWIALLALGTSLAPASAVGMGWTAAITAMLFAGMRGADMDHDQYMLLIDLFSDSDATGLAHWLIAKDPLFGLLLDVLGRVGAGPQWMFLVTAAAAALSKQIVFSRAFNGATAAAWLVCLCMYFFLHDYTQLRSALAVGFCLLALQALVEGRRWAWLLLGLIGTGFHISGLAFLLISSPLLWRTDRPIAWMWLLAAAMSLAMVGALGMLSEFDARALEHAETTGTTATPVVLSTLKLVGLCWLWRGLKSNPVLREDPLQRDLLRACFALASTSLLWLVLLRNSSSALAFRFSEFFDAFSMLPLAAAVMRLSSAYALVWLPYLALGIAMQSVTGLFVPHELAPLSAFSAHP